jgi:hypothetical protein
VGGALAVDADHPANRGVLDYLRGRAEGRPLVREPGDGAFAYLGAGSHPDVVERLWDRIAPAAGEDCGAMVFGAPALVHPTAGVVLGVALGTAYALRLLADDLQAAVAAGAELVHEYTVPRGFSLDLPDRFGSDWAFGSWNPDEPAWFARSFHHWSPR